MITIKECRWRAFLWLGFAVAIIVAVSRSNAAAALDDAPDPAVVNQKIQALAVRDDTLSYDERPRFWLRQRGERVYPQLVAGLAAPSTVVASNCLVILDTLPVRPSLVDALVRLASERTLGLNHQATLSLCRAAGDPRARMLLATALDDAERFPDPENRARFAEALGQPDRATELLVQCLDRKHYFELKPILERLVKLGQPAAIGPLERKTQDVRWEIAGAALLALDKLDPAKHGLTTNQIEFLENTRRAGKVMNEFYVERQKRLAALPRPELRPFVLQMLHTEDAMADALGILQLWKDQTALPDIRRLWTDANRWQMGGLFAAYLEIEGTDASVDEVMNLLQQQNDFTREQWVQGVVRSELALDRKVAFLRRVQKIYGRAHPGLVPHSLGWPRHDLALVLLPLMENETNLQTLAAFAAKVPAGTNHMFDQALVRAAERVATHGAADFQIPALAQAAATILNVCTDHQVPFKGRVTDHLLASTNSAVRLSAVRARAITGERRSQALELLNAELGNPQATVREQAAQCLLDIPCPNETERAQRESAALAQFGKPTEDCALRVLTTCAGPATAQLLLPVLDGDDAQRAVYVAWVLARHPDPEVATKALRRVGLYSIFHHEIYQQGAGIDFEIAPNLPFHQDTMRLNRQGSPVNGPPKLNLSPDMLMPRHLDQSEQAFLVRAYRRACSAQPHKVFFSYSLAGLNFDRLTDASYLDLLRVAAGEDPCLRALRVQGQTVAHFPNRKAAAEIVARLTGKPAAYLGLAGDELDSTTVSEQPYPKQNALVARFKLDRLVAAKLPNRPQRDREWKQVGAYDDDLRSLIDPDAFGTELKNAFLAEAQRRGISEALKTSGFSFWR